MCDEKDPGTVELPLPRKRGRPAKFGTAMTPAERARLYRRMQKYPPPGGIQEYSDKRLLDAVRRTIADGGRYTHMYLEELARRYPEDREAVERDA